MKYIKLLENNKINFNDIDEIDNVDIDNNKNVFYINIFDDYEVYLAKGNINSINNTIELKFYNNYNDYIDKNYFDMTSYYIGDFIENGKLKPIVKTLSDGDINDCYYLLKNGDKLYIDDLRLSDEVKDYIFYSCGIDIQENKDLISANIDALL
jgi:hypothetical protein